VRGACGPSPSAGSPVVTPTDPPSEVEDRSPVPEPRRNAGEVLPQSEPRVWRGIPRVERVQERRSRLIEAGLEVFGTVGLRETTVGTICAQAHLTQRYFYESFPNLKALLAEVFTVVTERQHQDMATSALDARREGGDLIAAAQAALMAYFSSLQADRRVARVQLLEILGCDDGTDRCYQAAIRRAADLVLVVSDIREVAAPAVPRLLALGLIGAVIEIALMWFLADFADPLAAVVGSALVIFQSVITVAVHPPV